MLCDIPPTKIDVCSTDKTLSNNDTISYNRVTIFWPLKKPQKLKRLKTNKKIQSRLWCIFFFFRSQEVWSPWTSDSQSCSWNPVFCISFAYSCSKQTWLKLMWLTYSSGNQNSTNEFSQVGRAWKESRGLKEQDWEPVP